MTLEPCSHCGPEWAGWLIGLILLSMPVILGLLSGMFVSDMRRTRTVLTALLGVSVPVGSWVCWYFFPHSPVFLLPWTLAVGYFIGLRIGVPRVLQRWP